MNEREEFEKWAEPEGLWLARNPLANDAYKGFNTRLAWTAWQARAIRVFLDAALVKIGRDAADNL